MERDHGHAQDSQYHKDGHSVHIKLQMESNPSKNPTRLFL